MTAKEIEILKLVYEKGDTDSPLYFSKKSDFGKALKAAIETLERIPKGHGRLIDADAFCEKLKQISDERRYDILFSDNLLSVGDVFDAIIADLNGTATSGYMNVPTIIEADRKG